MVIELREGYYKILRLNFFQQSHFFMLALSLYMFTVCPGNDILISVEILRVQCIDELFS